MIGVSNKNPGMLHKISIKSLEAPILKKPALAVIGPQRIVYKLKDLFCIINKSQVNIYQT